MLGETKVCFFKIIDYSEPGHNTGTTAANSRTTATSGTTEDRLIVDAVDKIFLLEPNQHPLVTLLTNVGKTYDGKSWQGSSIMKAPTGNPQFDWHEDFYGGRYAKVSGTYTSAADQTCTVTGAGSSSGYIFTTGDVVKNARTGECMVISTVAATTIVLHTRAMGTTAAAAGADGDGLFIIGNVNEENATSRYVNTTQSTKNYNYTGSLIWV